MKLSARNIIKGKVKSIEIGAVNVEVVVEVSSDVEIASIITKKSCDSLGLEIGKEAYLVMKASNVMIAVD